MDQPRTDSLGRATFHHIARLQNIRPTPRALRWLRHIQRHGPQSSLCLHELTRDTHRCKDTALRQLQALRAGGYLALPPQQRATERAECAPYIYDLTKRGIDHLRERDLAEPTIRPTGHWWHGYLTACVTGSIDICAARAGFRDIPAHEIIAINGASLAIPHGQSRLIPDQLFALDYGGRFRVFALEVDRGTEPVTSPANRKSWARAITQYDDILANDLPRSHYGLRSNLLILWVFTSHARQRRFLTLMQDRPGTADRAILTQHIQDRTNPGNRPGFFTHLYDAPWQRADGSDVVIGRV